MWDVLIDHRLLKKEKIHPSLIKEAAKQIEPTPRQKLNCKYNKTVNVGNFKLFLVYEFQNENKIYIREAKKAVKKWEPP